MNHWFEHYDCIILGSGITGLATSYWLQKLMPNKTQLIVDRQDFLQGASAKNAGFLTVGSANFYMQNKLDLGDYLANDWLDFCQTNHEKLFAEGFLGKDVEYRQNGSYSITSKKIESEHFVKNSHCDFATLENEDIYFYSQDGSVNPVLLLQKLKSRLAVQFAFQQDYQIDHSQQQLIFRGQKKVGYDRLLNCTNAWSSQVDPLINVKPTRAQIFQSHPIHRRFQSNYYFSDDIVYVRQLPDRSVLVGGKRLVDSETEFTDTEQTNEKIQSSLLQFAQSRIHPSIQIKKSWSGIMGFSHTGRPQLICKPPQFALVGFSGHGMGMAFYAAQILAQSSLGLSVGRNQLDLLQ